MERRMVGETNRNHQNNPEENHRTSLAWRCFRRFKTFMNDRPFTHVSTNLNDLDPLTPIHSLYSRRITSMPYSHGTSMKGNHKVSSGYRNITKRIKIQTHPNGRFWRSWSTEYLAALREHYHKTGSNSQSIRVDIVQITMTSRVQDGNWL